MHGISSKIAGCHVGVKYEMKLSKQSSGSAQEVVPIAIVQVGIRKLWQPVCVIRRDGDLYIVVSRECSDNRILAREPKLVLDNK